MPQHNRALSQESKSGSATVEDREAEALSALFALSSSNAARFKKMPMIGFSKKKRPTYRKQPKSRENSHSESKVSKKHPGTKRKAAASALSDDYELRRREQRRLSAQARREKKRNTLSVSEDANNALKEKLDRVMSQMEGLEPKKRQAIEQALAAIAQREKRPDYTAMLMDAKEKLMNEEDLEQPKASKPKPKGKVSRTESETFRRERNRLSAKLSRLRKRIRLEYLCASQNFIEHQLQYLREHLYDFPTINFPSPS
jgi:hypothetical protein